MPGHVSHLRTYLSHLRTYLEFTDISKVSKLVPEASTGMQGRYLSRHLRRYRISKGYLSHLRRYLSHLRTYLSHLRTYAEFNDI